MAHQSECKYNKLEVLSHQYKNLIHPGRCPPTDWATIPSNHITYQSNFVIREAGWGHREIYTWSSTSFPITFWLNNSLTNIICISLLMVQGKFKSCGWLCLCTIELVTLPSCWPSAPLGVSSLGLLPYSQHRTSCLSCLLLFCVTSFRG